MDVSGRQQGGGTCPQEMQSVTRQAKRSGARPEGLRVKRAEISSQEAGDKVQGTTGQATGARQIREAESERRRKQPEGQSKDPDATGQGRRW
jgi:hypothetical protein